MALSKMQMFAAQAFPSRMNSRAGNILTPARKFCLGTRAIFLSHENAPTGDFPDRFSS
jgi:hypothetical protein